jgi:diadenosine tetraphosphate (Ap4A) HIT family hydrolase
MSCELCALAVEPVWKNEKFSVILVDDANYPGFCRVIWNDHVQEMTDLAPADRSALMQAVCKVEDAIRATMAPHKINLASLGNMVPHLHWHVIPRFPDDAHFPSPVWASAQREPDQGVLASRQAKLPALRAAIVARMDA